MGLNLACNGRADHVLWSVVTWVLYTQAAKPGDEITAHCTGQYFDFWHCIDHCVSANSSRAPGLISPCAGFTELGGWTTSAV